MDALGNRRRGGAGCCPGAPARHVDPRDGGRTRHVQVEGGAAEGESNREAFAGCLSSDPASCLAVLLSRRLRTETPRHLAATETPARQLPTVPVPTYWCH